MTAGNGVFVDANILVYFAFAAFNWHAAARARLSELERVAAAFWTSRQVLREFLAAVTRPGFVDPPATPTELARLIRIFEDRFHVVEDDDEVTALLLELLQNPGAKGKQVHDANIVATMRRHSIPYLLTNNAADFNRYARWITVLPLA